ncbi:site-specific integrase [Thalassobacter stenotrophicus]|nr:site-specific integrase [Thalassobacter stenotrophicus]
MGANRQVDKKLVENLGAGRHGDGGGLYLVVDPSGARRWIVRVVVKGQKNRKGAPLRTDFGLGGADVVTLNQARERALEYRRMAKQGLTPRFNASLEIPTFEDVAKQVHIDRMPTWKNAKHGQQWINTLRDYAFPKIGRMPIDSVDQAEVMMCLGPIWTEKHETAKRLAQRIKTVLDVAKAKGMRWEEVDLEKRLWLCPEERMKGGEEHRVPLTDEMLAIIEPLRAMQSEYVFEGQKRNKPLSNMSMLMLLRRMNVEGVTVHGFRSTFRDWAGEVAGAPREVAEMSLSHKVGSDVERAYARSDLLDRRRLCCTNGLRGFIL